MGTIRLILEKDGETKDLSFDAVVGLVGAAKEIRRALKEGWQLVGVSGDMPQMVAFIQKQIDDYKKAPKDYSLPTKDMLHAATTMTGKSARAIAQAGRRAVSARVGQIFRRSKIPCSRCGRVKNVQRQPEGSQYAFLCQYCRGAKE